MIKTLIKATIVGVLGGTIVPAVLTGMVRAAAAVLTARILFTAFVGLFPLLLPSAAIARSTRVSAGPGRVSA